MSPNVPICLKIQKCHIKTIVVINFDVSNTEYAEHNFHPNFLLIRVRGEEKSGGKCKCSAAWFLNLVYYIVLNLPFEG